MEKNNAGTLQLEYTNIYARLSDRVETASSLLVHILGAIFYAAVVLRGHIRHLQG